MEQLARKQDGKHDRRTIRMVFSSTNNMATAVFFSTLLSAAPVGREPGKESSKFGFSPLQTLGDRM